MRKLAVAYLKIRDLTSALDRAYPVSLALSVFPQTTNNTALRLNDGNSPPPVNDPPPDGENTGGNTVEAGPQKDKGFKEKIDERKEILKGEAEHCLNPDLFGRRNNPFEITWRLV